MTSKHDSSIKELSDALRKFFANLLDIQYQFTYDELNEELFNHNLDWKFRAQIDLFFKRLNEMEFGGRQVSEHELHSAIREAEAIIKRLSGYVEERPQSRAAAWGNMSFLERVKRISGVSVGREILGIKRRLKSSFARHKEVPETPNIQHDDLTTRVQEEHIAATNQPERSESSDNDIGDVLPEPQAPTEPQASPEPPEPPPPPEPTHKRGLPPSAPEPSTVRKRGVGAIAQQSICIEGLMRNLDAFAGKSIILKGTIKFVNKIIQKGDFWYMFTDNSGDIVAVSKKTGSYSGKGKLSGVVKKTLTGDAFIEIDGFKTSQHSLHKLDADIV